MCQMCRDAGSYCALLVDPDGTVVDGDRVTPVILDQSGTRLRYPPPRAGAVESVTLGLLLRALREGAGSDQTALEQEWGYPEASSFTIQECVLLPLRILPLLVLSEVKRGCCVSCMLRSQVASGQRSHLGRKWARGRAADTCRRETDRCFHTSDAWGGERASAFALCGDGGVPPEIA